MAATADQRQHTQNALVNFTCIDLKFVVGGVEHWTQFILLWLPACQGCKQRPGVYHYTILQL